MSERPQPPIRVAHASDGSVIYLVAAAPDALPPVRSADLLEAWDAAREAAAGAAWGLPRLFRFSGPDGETLDLALADEDACCWAGAVDVTAGISSLYGLSLCLRLLALVDLLARAPWTGGLCRIGRAGAALDPALVRTAATTPLTAPGRLRRGRLPHSPRSNLPPSAHALPHRHRSLRMIRTARLLARSPCSLPPSRPAKRRRRRPPPTPRSAPTAVSRSTASTAPRTAPTSPAATTATTAFSASYDSGLVSRGIGAQYQVDQMLTDCLRASGDQNAQPTPGVGPVFSPAERGAGTSTLRP